MAVEITLRSMKTGDLESIAEIANTEDGWNICPSDYKIWAKIFNQKSLIVAEHDGITVGSIVGVQLSKEIGYIGVYFVRNKYRGKGVGLALWNAVWPSLHMNCSNICLASVPEMRAKYQDVFGFNLTEPWTIDQSNGVPNQLDSPVPEGTKLIKNNPKIIQSVSNFDQDICKFDRSRWLKLWLDHPNGFSLIAIGVNESVVGYGVIRRGYERARIGPLYANSFDIALCICCELIKIGLKQFNEVNEVALLHRSNDQRMVKIAKLLGLKTEVDCYMMYTKEKIPFDIEKIFAFSDYEVNFV